MRNKFLQPPARTSFLSMLLLFPYFLCCPPSPPCRAALHAGACWPWRPTRYCQPSFHAPFCGLKIFLRKGAPFCMSADPPPPLSLHPCLSPCSTAFSSFYSSIPRQSRSNECPDIPCEYLGLNQLVGYNFIAFRFCIFFFSFWARKRRSTCSVCIIFFSRLSFRRTKILILDESRN